MAKFAPVVPIPVAQAYREAGMLGDYQLLLAHDVIKRPGDYAQTYSHNQWIIMDNSVIELGYPLSEDEMREAIGVVHASVFVLPDELLDKDQTILKTFEALNTWGNLITDSTKGMAVPQGTTFDEWVECVEAFAQIREIDWIGIPRNVKEKLGTSRVKAAEIVQTVCPDKKIHMLGFSDDIQDDVAATRVGGAVMGIDSAVPSRMGMRDQKVITLANPDHSPRGDWWDNPGEVNDLAITNVTVFRSWLT